MYDYVAASMKLKAACPSEKKKYFDRSTAEIIAKQDQSTTGDSIRAYICLECGWWHVGHRRKKKKKVNDGAIDG